MSSGDTVGHVMADRDPIGQGGQVWVHRADQVDYDRAARTKRCRTIRPHPCPAQVDA
jgi:hypothetical protein